MQKKNSQSITKEKNACICPEQPSCIELNHKKQLGLNPTTTLNKINEYFNEFYSTQKNHSESENDSIFLSFQSLLEKNSSPYDIDTSEITKMLNLLSIQFPNFRKNQINNNTDSSDLDDRVVKALQNFQKRQKQKIQRQISHSKRFIKLDSFSQKLIIHSLKPSRHYEVIKMQIQLLQYKTSVCILNATGKNPLPSFSHVYVSGGFGNVYSVETSKEFLAIKLICLSSKQAQSKNFQQRLQKIEKILKEYFFVLIFSQLQIGPKAKTIGGFDLIMYEDSMMFATEICEFSSRKQNRFGDLKENLLKMHMFKIVHRDIKPSNIMYSNTFRKNVFIDFGCSQAIQQNLGMKKLSYFAGTTAYCSEEVRKLFDGKPDFVDLYFNDIYALKISMSESNLFKSRLQDAQINKINTPIMELIQMKFHLYSSKWQDFRSLWKHVNKKFDDDQLQNIRIQLLRFFPEIDELDEFKQFYWHEIDESIRNLSQFAELKLIFKSAKPQFFMEFCEYSQKKKQFGGFSEIFQTIQVKNGSFSNQQKNYRLMIVSKEKIEKELSKIRNQIQAYQNKESDQDLIFHLSDQEKINTINRYCYVVANYSSLNTNKYNSSIQQKIQACSNFFKLHEKYFPDRIQSFQATQTYRKQKYNPIVKLHYFYIKEIARMLPIQKTFQQIFQSLFTLCILQYPIYNQQNYHWLLCQVFGEKWPIQPEISDQNVEEFTSDVIKFWQLQIIGLFYVSKQDNYTSYDNRKLQCQCAKLETKLYQNMKNFRLKDQKDSKQLLVISSICAKNFLSNEKCITEKTIQELLNRLMSPSVLGQTKTCLKSQELHSLLCRYIVLLLTRYKERQNFLFMKIIKKSLILNHKMQQQFFILITFSWIFSKTGNYSHPKVIKKIQSMLNCTDLSSQYCKEQIFLQALKSNNFIQIKECVEDLRSRQVKFSDKIIQMHIVKNTIQIIISFFINLSKFTQPIELLIEKTMNSYPFIEFYMEIGYNFLTRKKSLHSIFSVSVNALTFNQIEFQLTRIDIFYKVYGYLHRLGKAWEQFRKFIRQRKIQSNFQLSSAHKNLYMILKQNYKKIDLVKNWEDFFAINPSAKNVIKSNEKLTHNFVQFLIPHCDSKLKFQIICQMINEFYQTVQIQDCLRKNHDSAKVLQSLTFYYKFQVTFCNSIQNHNKIVQIYHNCLKCNDFQAMFNNNESYIFLFSFSLVYTNRPDQEIIDLARRYCLLLKTSRNQQKIKKFVATIEDFKWHQTFQSHVNFHPFKLAKSISYIIHTFDPTQNPYMSLILRYLLKEKRIPTQVSKIFLVYMMKSIQNLNSYSKAIIKSSILDHVKRNFQYKQKRERIYKKNDDLKIVSMKFPISQSQNKIHRKYIWIHLNAARKNENLINQPQKIMRYFLFKEQYFQGYKYPDLMKKYFHKKIKRYCKIWQSFQKDKKNQIQQNQ